MTATASPHSAPALGRLTITLHWLVALSIIGLSALGIYMSGGNNYSVYDLHKSIGVLVFVLVLARVLWRIREGWPAPVRRYPRFEQTLAKAVHWVLILGTLIMPISGMMYSGFSGHGFGVFSVTLVPELHAPDDATQVIPRNDTLDALAHGVHHYVGYLLVAAVGLHILGAFKHHLLDRDGTLRRMLGRPL